MRVDRETAHPAYGLPLRVYAITRDEYERTAGATADGH
jgi:hypothetical protein